TDLLTLSLCGVCIHFASTISSAEPNMHTEQEVPRYKLHILLVPEANRLEVQGEVHLPAAKTPRTELMLRLSASMHDFQAEVIAPSVSAGPVALESAEEGDSDRRWILRPKQPVPPGQPVLLRFAYMGGERPGSNFSLGSEASYASAWGTAWYPLPAGA